MQKTEQIRVLKGLMKHLDAGTNVDAGGQVHNPVSAYTCPDVAAEEWHAFFQNYPQVLGLSADLPNGSFFTSRALGKPILCTRDGAGEFRAFLNVCRHRGTIVESEVRGEKKQFNCPFHGWGYNLAGELVAVPKENQFGAVDRSCHSLIALRAAEKHGLLWVTANPEATCDVDALLGGLGEELQSWRLGDAIRHGDATYETPMNWKLAIDTFGETYHFPVLHRDSLAADFHGNVQLYDTYGRNHRMLLCLKNIDTLRSVPEDDWHVLLGSAPVYYLFPNIQLILTAGGPILVRVYPDGVNPHRSFSEITFYRHAGIRIPGIPVGEGTEEMQALLTERMEGFASVIQAEDYVAATSAHQGALSGAQEFVIFGRNEPALHHYHNTYREALGMPSLDVISN